MGTTFAPPMFFLLDCFGVPHLATFIFIYFFVCNSLALLTSIQYKVPGLNPRPLYVSATDVCVTDISAINVSLNNVNPNNVRPNNVSPNNVSVSPPTLIFTDVSVICE